MLNEQVAMHYENRGWSVYVWIMKSLLTPIPSQPSLSTTQLSDDQQYRYYE